MATSKTPAESELLEFATAKAFERWLARNYTNQDGAWLKFAKKASNHKTISYAEAVEVALCYGWIDAQVRGLDADYTLQRFCPRRARSKWSKVNTEHAERLIKEGRMREPGLREIKRAKADGRWAAAYEPPSRSKVPDDLAAALAKRKKAHAFFEKLDSRNRYAILYRLQDAKKPETRARRIAQFVQMMKDGRKLYD